MDKIKELTEEKIIETINEVLDGHDESFVILYNNYYRMVVSIIKRIIRPNLSEMDALVNESFLLVYKSLKGFKGNSKFSTYIYRIVLNYAFKVSKKQYKEKQKVFNFSANQAVIDSIPSSFSMSDQVITNEFLEKAIGTLTKDMQEALDLYYYDQYSIKEIAHITDSTETAIKNRLYQARNKIKAMLPEGVSYD